MAVQPDGKIVVAGTWDGGQADFAVARLNPDATPDSSFSGDGRQNITFGAAPYGGVERATAVALQPNGKIAAAGYTDAGGTPQNPNDFALARFNPDGSPDPTFSGDGKQTANFGFDDRANAIALQPNGDMVVAGYASNGATPGNPENFAVAVMKPDGSLDTIFDHGTGRIAVAGHTTLGGTPTNPRNMAVVELGADGKLDTSFGSGAHQTVDFGRDDVANSVAAHGDQIVLAGRTAPVGGLGDFAVARRTLSPPAASVAQPTVPEASAIAAHGAPRPADTTGPVLSGLALSPRAFPAAHGAQARFALNEPATVTFVVARRTTRRRHGAACVGTTARNRSARHCVRFVRIGAITRQGAAGANVFRFAARIAGLRLRPAAYRLSASARDAAGNMTRAPARTSFTVKPH